MSKLNSCQKGFERRRRVTAIGGDDSSPVVLLPQNTAKTFDAGQEPPQCTLYFAFCAFFSSLAYTPSLPWPSRSGSKQAPIMLLTKSWLPEVAFSGAYQAGSPASWNMQ